jgi:hypothetical protein
LGPWVLINESWYKAECDRRANTELIAAAQMRGGGNR